MAKPLKRVKPYKAKPPHETVRIIRAIFSDLGAEMIETPVEGNAYFKACKLSLINPENQQEVFTTYGKGGSSEWASASAWGEMIERVQNLAFYSVLLYPSEGEREKQTIHQFFHFPDEKYFLTGKHSNSVFADNFFFLTGISRHQYKNSHWHAGIPFYEIFERKTAYFPFREMQVIVGSNGMCSGNTPEEALIQGISEIFERFVMKSLYKDPFCPPDIPLSCFEGTEISEKINLLIHQFGYRIRIKDCSMGKGYPVIGVLLSNDENGHAFHLGADPSPITALERCFTEIFQGGAILFQPAKELIENLPYNLDADFWRKSLGRTIQAYAGQWPPDLLADAPSYEFAGFEHPESVSDQQDLQFLFAILKRDSRKLFVRDNSFLGQPAYSVYIPGMSEITSFPDNSFSTAFLEFDQFLPVMANLKRSTGKERTNMLRSLQKYVDVSPDKEFHTGDYFRYYPKHPVGRLNSEQLLGLISFSILQGRISDHFSLSEMQSLPFLRSLCGGNESFRPRDVFHRMNLPDCFNCSSCNHKNDCNLPFISEFWERLKEKMKRYDNNQINLLNLEDASSGYLYHTLPG
jgi:ribosomal protein S12 methylthiotransferase accessory factor